MPFELFMREALREAHIARDKGEVPVGAVVVDKAGVIVSKAHNQRESLHDPTAHAEILALRAAGQATGMWRMEGFSLYVTLEPCPMCAGAAVQSRVERIVYGCDDPKAGACGTLMNVAADARLNHRVETIGGVLELDCKELLTKFFEERR